MTAPHRVLWLALALLAPAKAHAHAPVSGAGDFFAGVLHPLTDLELLPSLFVLGLLAGRAGQHVGARVALTGAASASVAGLTAFVAGWHPWVPLALGLATLLTALAVAADLELPRSIRLALATLLGAALGAMQASELPTAVFGVGAAVGIAIALLYLTVLGAAARNHWQRIAVRVAASWVAAIVTLMLGLALR